MEGRLEGRRGRGLGEGLKGEYVADHCQNLVNSSMVHNLFVFQISLNPHNWKICTANR